jgi:hypothetical protein
MGEVRNKNRREVSTPITDVSREMPRQIKQPAVITVKENQNSKDTCPVIERN